MKKKRTSEKFNAEISDNARRRSGLLLSKRAICVLKSDDVGPFRSSPKYRVTFFSVGINQ